MGLLCTGRSKSFVRIRPESITYLTFDITTLVFGFYWNCLIMRTASVVRRSEFLATDPEVRIRFLALPDFLRSSVHSASWVQLNRPHWRDTSSISENWHWLRRQAVVAIQCVPDTIFSWTHFPRWTGIATLMTMIKIILKIIWSSTSRHNRIPERTDQG
jgi:hypothetical protein